MAGLTPQYTLGAAVDRSVNTLFTAVQERRGLNLQRAGGSVESARDDSVQRPTSDETIAELEFASPS